MISQSKGWFIRMAYPVGPFRGGMGFREDRAKVDLNFEQLPFSLLGKQGRDRLRQAVEMTFLSAGTVILDAGDATDYVYVVHKGVVVEMDPRAPEASARIAVYTDDDLFGAITVFNGTSRYRFKVEEEALCYLIPAELFQALCNEEPAFADYFQARLAAKSQLLAERREGGVTLAGFMLARVSECMREPVLLPADGTIGDAATELTRHGVDSLLLKAGGQVGVITKTDLLRGLVEEGLTPRSPALGLASFALVTVDLDEFLFAALVRMTRHQVTRVVVMAEGRALGVVELPDVLSFFSSRSYVVGLEVERAEDMDALVLASARLPELVQALMAQGVRMRFAMELMAVLNGRIIARAFEFLMPRTRAMQCCLMVFGSEGRGEQILKTDQDNGLILEEDLNWPELRDLSRAFTDTLVRLGYPRCPGGIMASNPEWVGTLTDWRRRIRRWVGQGDDAAMMRLAILADAHPVAGQVPLVERLRDLLFEHCSHDEILLSQFARPVLHFATPLTLFGTLKTRDQTLDIKKGGVFPLVHGVRALSLRYRIRETNTLSRMARLVDAGHLEAEVADDLGGALAVFSELRLRQQIKYLSAPGAALQAGNQVSVAGLSSLERDMLRDALHVVNDFKKSLSRRFHLEY